jgi:predicted permease
MDAVRQDLVFAWRMLRKDRAYALTVILTLAVCLGANAAIGTVVRSILFRPLPYPEPERLIHSYDSFPGAGVERAGTSVPNYFDRRALTGVFDEVALYQFAGYRVGQGASAEGVSAMDVTPSFFRVLRVEAAAGRLFREDEGSPGHDKVVVLSHAFASKQPGGVDGMVGRQVRLDDQIYDVVGVLPEAFHFLNPEIRLFVPLAFTDEDRAEDRRYSQNHEQIARLAPGVTLEQAQAQVDALNAQFLDRAGTLKAPLIKAGYTTKTVEFEADLVRNVRAALQLLWGGVLFVVLIAAVNIANLSLVRGSGRMKELATRSAIGAGRGRIAFQLVIEATLLTAIGGALGLLVGYWSLGALEWLGLSDLPRAHEIRMDEAVFGFTLGLALLLGFVVGAAPAVQLARSSLSNMLRDEGRSGTAGRGTQFVRRALAVSQVALAFVLLVGAGLLFASFRQILAVQPGFNADGVLTASVSLPRARYKDDQALVGFTHEALARLRALPGVSAVGATDTIPFGGNNSDSVIFAEGYQMKPGESPISPAAVDITPGYFEAMGVKLVRGRLFDERDRFIEARTTSVGGRPNGAYSIIIDETLAKRFWPGQDPVGRRMYKPNDIKDLTAITERTVFYTVVGVIADIKLHDLTEAKKSVGAYFFPMDQDTSTSMTFAMRTAVDPLSLTSAVRNALGGLDRELPVFDTQTMDQRMEKSLVSRRSPVVLSLVFGGVALLLSAIGIYGVLAYLVTQRRREIGIRIALGSSARSIFELVLREGLLLIIGGFVIGAAGALALRKSLESQLFGVSATDPLVLAAVTGLLAAVAVVACALPARRATRINPIVALAE